MAWFTQPFLSAQATSFLFPPYSVGLQGYQIQTSDCKMGHCFATCPLEMPRNFSNIFHIVIACGLVILSCRVVQSWRSQDIKLSYEAVWTVYPDTFVLYRIIWNTLASFPFSPCCCVVFTYLLVKWLWGTCPLLFCHVLVPIFYFPGQQYRVGICSFISVTNICLWCCDTWLRKPLLPFLSSFP